MQLFLRPTDLPPKTRIVGLSPSGGLVFSDPSGKIYVSSSNPNEEYRVSMVGQVRLKAGDRIIGLDSHNRVIIVNNGWIDIDHLRSPQDLHEELRFGAGYITLQRGEYVAGVNHMGQIIVADLDGNVFHEKNIRLAGERELMGKVKLPRSSRVIALLSVTEVLYTDSQNGVHVYNFHREASHEYARITILGDGFR